MSILALTAIAIVFVALFQIVRVWRRPRADEQSLAEMECEMMALEAEYAAAVQIPRIESGG